jgi:hypothetical protein
MHLQLPPLAGLCTYAEAGQVGYGVEDNVRRLLRYDWIEKRLMEVELAWLAPTPEWEAKEAFGLHASLDAEHVAALRKRIGEMRNPLPRMDVSPDPALDGFFDELLCARTTLEKLAGLYGVLRPALLAAYREHLAHANPIADYPTVRMLRHILLDEEECQAWGVAAQAACILAEPDRTTAEEWQSHLTAYLAAAGGIMGAEPRLATLPPGRTASTAAPDYFPQRDERFALRWTFVNPQRQVSLDESLPLDERTLALMCRRIVEMDVPEYLSRIIAQSQDEAWEYYVDMTRQLWDEVRHAMLGTVYFEQRGIDWKAHIAIHPGMSIRLHSLDVRSAHMVLFAIEQNLMPGNTGKRLEYEISSNAQDPLAAQIQDYDWADEVLHVHIGRKWLLPKLALRPDEAVKQGWEMRARTAEVLDQYEQRGEQKNWWPNLVRLALGRETAMQTFDLARL